MNMERERRVTEVMNSLDGIQKAKAPQDGFAKIQRKLAEQRKQLPLVKQPTTYGWMKIAAVIALVITSNVWVVSNYMASDSNTSSESDSYTQLLTDLNLYENE